MAKAKIGDIANLPVFTGENGILNVKDAAAALEALGLPYEVGTWEPEFVCMTSGGAILPGKPVATWGSNSQAWYTRLGNICAVFCILYDVSITDIGDSSAFFCAIGNLPYYAPRTYMNMPVLHYPAYTKNCVTSVSEYPQISGSSMIVGRAPWLLCDNVTMLLLNFLYRI